MTMFIVVQQYGKDEDEEWTILGLRCSFHEAHLLGWTVAVNESLKPHKLKFYKNPKAAFADFKFGSSYHIEEWDDASSTPRNTYFLGTNPKWWGNTVGLDCCLKAMGDKCEERLLDWKSELDDGIIPSEFHAFLL
jgi:hypothetical protein